MASSSGPRGAGPVEEEEFRISRISSRKIRSRITVVSKKRICFWDLGAELRLGS